MSTVIDFFSLAFLKELLLNSGKESTDERCFKFKPWLTTREVATAIYSRRKRKFRKVILLTKLIIHTDFYTGNTTGILIYMREKLTKLSFSLRVTCVSKHSIGSF